MPKQLLELDLDQAIHAIAVRDNLAGPGVPENPLARLIADTPEMLQLPSRAAALARMRTARIVCLKRHFDRQYGGITLEDILTRSREK